MRTEDRIELELNLLVSSVLKLLFFNMNLFILIGG